MSSNTCPLCGWHMRDDLPACGRCPMHHGCGMVCCGNCGYRTVAAHSRIIDFVKRLFGRKTV